jgi:hypothetical protein
MDRYSAKKIENILRRILREEEEESDNGNKTVMGNR